MRLPNLWTRRSNRPTGRVCSCWPVHRQTVSGFAPSKHSMVDTLLSRLSGQTSVGQPIGVLERRVLEELAKGALHGQRVVKIIDLSGFSSEDHVARATYIALRHLEKWQLVASAWRMLPGRPVSAKFYWLTARGTRTLQPHLADGGSNVDERIVPTLMVLALFNSNVLAAAASRSPQGIVTLMLDARARIRPDEIARATVEVTRILGAIGVQVRWIPGATDTNRSDHRLEPAFTIHVIVLARTDRLVADALPLGLTPPATTPCGADIVIFKDHVDEFARVRGRPIPLILGLVLAHEIGHALLPKPAHTSVGIMQAPWDQETMTQASDPGLQFTAQQGALIRARLNRSCSSIASP